MRVHYDTIHKPVTDLLKSCGWSVFDAARVGKGFPDLVIGRLGKTHLIELKTGNAPFKESQKKFYREWKGEPVIIFRSVDEVKNWLGVK